MTMFDCPHCGDRHHVNDFCATGPLAAHPAPEQVAEAQDAAVGGLLERLESGKGKWSADKTAEVLVNPDGPEAASVIRSLQAERDALEGNTAYQRLQNEALLDRAVAAEARAERAEAERDALRKALEPFASLGQFDADLTERWPERQINNETDTVLAWAGGFDLTPPRITYGDIRRARAALALTAPSPKGGARDA